MNKTIYIRSILLFFVALTGFGVCRADPRLVIRSIMDRQVRAWNQGDIEAFMEGYWESEELMFIGSRGLTYGWQQTLQNYKKSYPDQEAMGHLTFEYKEWVPLGRRHMLVIGRWQLSRSDGETLDGYFSLIWKKTRSGWVIIADHSS